jgi:hypothetical protein
MMFLYIYILHENFNIFTKFYYLRSQLLNFNNVEISKYELNKIKLHVKGITMPNDLSG